MSIVDPPISASSAVVADLPVSWNTGAATRYWYRVEGICGPATCENLGLQFDGCNNVLLLTTVSATSVPELCEVLANPRTNAPLVTQIVSIRRYSRPVFKADIQADQCNVLEAVEFCQIPECFDFCPQPTGFMPTVRTAPVGPRRLRKSSLSSLSDYDFGVEDSDFPLLAESGDPLLGESGEPVLGEAPVPSPATPGLFVSGSAEVHCTFFAHDSSGSVSLGGFAFFVSPLGVFNGSGSVVVGGRGALVTSFSASGGASVSGSALFDLALSREMSGGVVVSGGSSHESPNYTYEASGAAFLQGAAWTNFSSLGTIEVPSAMAASVFGMGLEVLEPTTPSYLTISSFEVSACGCTGIGPTMTLRHNLLRSQVFSGFLNSSGLSYPSSLPLRYKSSEKTWSSVDYLKGRNSDWVASMSMQCRTDVWRLSIGVSEGQRQTRLVLDIPADVICGEGYVTTSVVAYFNSYSPSGSGERIQVVTPDKSRYLSVLGEVDVFVNDIFVPQTVYYDELGLFKDSYWGAAPLEIDLNPVARNKSTLMDMSWV